MKKKLKPVEGSADEDNRKIEEANQIRLRAINIGHPNLVEPVNFSSAACLISFPKL